MDELATTDRGTRGGAPATGDAPTDTVAEDHGVRALLRLTGELSTKSRRTRSRFQRRLLANLRDTVPDGRVRNEWSRFFIRVADPADLDPLGRVFGISSYSVLEGECEAELASIVELGRRLFHERVVGRRFAVRARRSGRHPFDSRDVMVELGAALNPGATVDLDDPEIEVRVEVREGRAYLFSERRAGAGGLPIGVEGRALALLSGGFDSAVAAWMALRRGIELDYLFCNLGGAAYRRMVLEVAKVLSDRWSYGYRPLLHVVEFGEVVGAMRRGCLPSYLQVVLKRLMYRAGTEVGAEAGAEALVTGESVGQVSSQTLSNLRAIDPAAGLPVLRPLVGFDKEEILARARSIGTYDRSARVREYCAIGSGRPVTAASPESAAEQEAAVDRGPLVEALEARETIDLRALNLTELAGESLFVDEMTPVDVVLDARPAEAYEAWHWPGAVRVDPEELARRIPDLDRERRYVLVCPEGVRTAHLAERMQALGLEAYSFRGGARALRRHLTRTATEATSGSRTFRVPESGS